MSMQICVFSDTQLNATSEWQQAIDAASLPLRLSYEKPLAQAAGFLPGYLAGKLTGFEYRRRDPKDISSTYPNIHFGHNWKFVAVFIWGADLNEMQAAWMAAAAYAMATEGILFDEQEESFSLLRRRSKPHAS
jgi:hypothetical protein